jgi:hypothetical protein
MACFLGCGIYARVSNKTLLSFTDLVASRVRWCASHAISEHGKADFELALHYAWCKRMLIDWIHVTASHGADQKVLPMRFGEAGWAPILGSLDLVNEVYDLLML